MRLRESGYRVIEQLFPRRAYVVVGYPELALPFDDEIEVLNRCVKPVVPWVGE
jgi:hypothetical protein